jgi:hypothetical protein
MTTPFHYTWFASQTKSSQSLTDSNFLVSATLPGFSQILKPNHGLSPTQKKQPGTRVQADSGIAQKAINPGYLLPGFLLFGHQAVEKNYCFSQKTHG